MKQRNTVAATPTKPGARHVPEATRGVGDAGEDVLRLKVRKVGDDFLLRRAVRGEVQEFDL